jgi:hypothetical protein
LRQPDRARNDGGATSGGETNNFGAFVESQKAKGQLWMSYSPLPRLDRLPDLNLGSRPDRGSDTLLTVNAQHFSEFISENFL